MPALLLLIPFSAVVALMVFLWRCGNAAALGSKRRQREWEAIRDYNCTRPSDRGLP